MASCLIGTKDYIGYAFTKSKYVNIPGIINFHGGLSIFVK